jgi:hemoglobin
MNHITFGAWLVSLAWAAAPATARAADALYARLGGQDGVNAIAATLIDRAAADPLTGPNFVDSKLDRIKQLLGEQLCELAGGPCVYSGDPMKEVHAGHHISEAQFYRMVEELKQILAERGVDQRATNELLRLLAPMKRDVVERRPYKTRPKAAPAAEAASAADAAADDAGAR